MLFTREILISEVCHGHLPTIYIYTHIYKHLKTSQAISVFQAEMAELQAICLEVLMLNSNSSGFANNQ